MHIMKEKKPLKPATTAKVPPKDKKSRSLKEEDILIWGQATENVTKFAASNIIHDDTPKRLKRHYREHFPQNITGKITLETFGAAAPPATALYPPSSFQVDTSLRKRFERGELPIDGKIDLHGMTLAEAHHRFIRFMDRKIKEGARFVLVVTGKGSGDGGGVIRRNLPLWCDDKSLKPYILQFAQAQPRHGGSGASYILLRRQK